MNVEHIIMKIIIYQSIRVDSEKAGIPWTLFLCSEHEDRKAEINKENVVAIFFDIEKAYNMMWREGLVIKLNKLGIKGSMHRYIKDFLFEKSFKFG